MAAAVWLSHQLHATAKSDSQSRFPATGQRKDAAFARRSTAGRHADLVNNAAPLVKLRAELRDRLNELANAETLDKVKTGLWSEFEPQKPAPDKVVAPIPVPTIRGLGELALVSSAQAINRESGAELPQLSAEEVAFQNFRKRFTPTTQFDKFNASIAAAMQELENQRLTRYGHDDVSAAGQTDQACDSPAEQSAVRYDRDDLGSAQRRREKIVC